MQILKNNNVHSINNKGSLYSNMRRLHDDLLPTQCTSARAEKSWAAVGSVDRHGQQKHSVMRLAKQ